MLAALSVNATEAARFPVAIGANETVSVHCAEAAGEEPQLLFKLKSEHITRILERVKDAWPTFVNVAEWGGTGTFTLRSAGRKRGFTGPCPILYDIKEQICGPVAQLGARMTGSHEVRGSNPLRSTNQVLYIQSDPVFQSHGT